MEISVGILCGGRSRRMGRDKALLERSPSDPTRFLDYLLREFGGCGEILLSVRKGQEYREHTGNFRCLEDETENCGPLEGIRRILSAVKSDYVFICAVDMPLLTRQAKHYLEQFVCSDYDAWVFEDETGQHPLCAIYSRGILPLIEEQLAEGDYKIRNLFPKIRTRLVSLMGSGLAPDTLKNINTIEDYRRLRG